MLFIRPALPLHPWLQSLHLSPQRKIKPQVRKIRSPITKKKTSSI